MVCVGGMVMGGMTKDKNIMGGNGKNGEGEMVMGRK